MADHMICNITSALAASMLPDRKPGEGKHSYGKLMGILGSNRYRGAAVLALMGAARSGVGLLSLASIEPVIQAVAMYLPECTYYPLTMGADGGIAHQALNFLLEESKSMNAVLVGCGLGLMNDIRIMMPAFVANCSAPLVIDADALNILSENVDILKRCTAPVILTPHYREMARLMNTSTSELAYDPIGCALNFAKEYGVTVVLKGSHTIIADKEGTLFSHNRDNPGLSKGGSGDLLAGLVAGFLAQGADPIFAAASAVYAHGEAAAMARSNLGEHGMLPQDVEQYLPAVLKAMAAEKQAGQNGVYPC